VACADINSDGQREIVTATSGSRSDVLVYRLEVDRLALIARRSLGSAPNGAWFNSRIEALADLDGDKKVELVVSTSRQVQLCPDPVFYPSRFDSCRLLILDPELRTRQEIPLPERCVSLCLADLIPGGNIDILMLSDRLTLYSTDLPPSE
jgi:hypothetical protein